jgi:hypothetical protein
MKWKFRSRKEYNENDNFFLFRHCIALELCPCVHYGCDTKNLVYPFLIASITVGHRISLFRVRRDLYYLPFLSVSFKKTYASKYCHST